VPARPKPSHLQRFRLFYIVIAAWVTAGLVIATLLISHWSVQDGAYVERISGQVQGDGD
jgi:hypothetical protein